MNSYVNINEITIDDECRQKLKMLFQFYIKHEYNLLGSGYIKVDYKLAAKGFRGRKYSNRWMGLYGKNVKVRLKGKCTFEYGRFCWILPGKDGRITEKWIFLFTMEIFITKKMLQSDE